MTKNDNRATFTTISQNYFTTKKRTPAITPLDTIQYHLIPKTAVLALKTIKPTSINPIK